jgi:hypothetical protein
LGVKKDCNIAIAGGFLSIHKNAPASTKGSGGKKGIKKLISGNSLNKDSRDLLKVC